MSANSPAGKEEEADDIDLAAANTLHTHVQQLEEISAGLPADAHDRVAGKVYRRLRLRYVQLRQLEVLTRAYRVHAELVESHRLMRDPSPPAPSPPPKPAPTEASTNSSSAPPSAESRPVPTKSSSPESESKSGQNTKNTPSRSLSPGQRAYHLAVADLFVEKALAYLEDQAASYKRHGVVSQVVAFAIVLGGAAIASVQMFRHDGQDPGSWMTILAGFTRSFTAYGMIVLTAVGLWRYGKAMLDQSERLLERRHALRQGRLFVHLNDGALSIEEMEKAFNWNVSQSNAFGGLVADAQAPWGTVAKELIQAAPELIRAGIQATAAGKASADTDKGGQK